MKLTRRLFDETLLKWLDARVGRDRRASVLRRAAAKYLRRRGACRILEAYRKAYAADGSLGTEWSGWEDEGAWPRAE